MIPERWDFGGSLADPKGKFCAVVDIGTNFPPFMKYSCTECPEGTGNGLKEDSAADKGWEEEVYLELCGYTEAAQVTSSSWGGRGTL